MYESKTTLGYCCQRSNFDQVFPAEHETRFHRRVNVEASQFLHNDAHKLNGRFKLDCLQTVSYTHLDVYKRQVINYSQASAVLIKK